MLGALGDWEQADDPLFGRDDPVVPIFEMDSERLGEAADHIVDEAQALLLPGRSAVFIVGVFVVFRSVGGVGFERRGLQGPQKERREAGVLFESTGGWVVLLKTKSPPLVNWTRYGPLLGMPAVVFETAAARSIGAA